MATCKYLISHVWFWWTLFDSGERSGLIQEIKRNEFFKYVNNCFQRHHEMQINLSGFKWVVTLGDNNTDVLLVDHWIQFASKKISNCSIFALEPRERYMYSLAGWAFMIKSLTVLTLTGCKLEKASFGNNTTKLYSLQELCLVDVFLDQPTPQNSISICSLIVTFTVKFCEGVKNIRISCLPKLEKVKTCMTPQSPGERGALREMLKLKHWVSKLSISILMTSQPIVAGLMQQLERIWWSWN